MVGVDFKTIFLLTIVSCVAVASLIQTQLSKHRQSTKSSEHGSNRLSHQQRLAFQQVVKTMMGFSSDVPPPLSTRPASSSSSSSSQMQGQGAPRYMYRLYERYKKGEPRQVADTVRNINAELAIVNNGSLFVFNLTSLGEAETVMKAEIHLYKRRRYHHHHHERSTASSPAAAAATDAAETAGAESDGIILIKVFELGPRSLRERASFLLTDVGHAGWYTFDVTAAVQDCSMAQRNSATPRLLAVSFSDSDEASASVTTDDNNQQQQQQQQQQQPSVKLLLSKFLRKMSRPFLMVFSEENRNNSLNDQLESLFHPSDATRLTDKSHPEKNSWQWDYDNPLITQKRQLLIRRKNKALIRSRALSQNGGDRMTLSPSSSFSSSSSSTSSFAKLRGHYSDDVFDIDPVPAGDGGNASNEWLHRYSLDEGRMTGSGKRSKFYHSEYKSKNDDEGGKERGKKRSTRKKRSTITDNEIPVDVAFEPEPELVPPLLFNRPKTNPTMLQGRSHSKRKHKKPVVASKFGEDGDGPTKRKRGGGTGATSISALLSYPKGYVGGRKRKGGEKMDSGDEREKDSPCGKRKLVVDFADIGWSDWIISPKSFEAHYCDGLCTFPMAKRLRPTNHATIQSVVKAIGLKKDVPSPCCVPSSLSSLTLLYFDENQNVVLKNYPDMTVRSCACR